MDTLYGDIGREGLIDLYGNEKVEWAEEFLAETDYRDEMDRN